MMWLFDVKRKGPATFASRSEPSFPTVKGTCPIMPSGAAVGSLVGDMRKYVPRRHTFAPHRPTKKFPTFLQNECLAEDAKSDLPATLRFASRSFANAYNSTSNEFRKQKERDTGLLRFHKRKSTAGGGRAIQPDSRADARDRGAGRLPPKGGGSTTRPNRQNRPSRASVA